MCQLNGAILRRSLQGLICLIIWLTACGQPATPALTPITVQLAWTHQAQFAGFYAADQNGYYEAEGLAVTFVEGGPGVDTIESLISDNAQISIAAADVFLLARSEGIPVNAIAVIYRRSPRVYVALAGSGITSPLDFIGKTIAVNTTGHPPFEAMMRRIGLQPDQYTVVDSTSDLGPFYSGEVQVRLVYLTNEVLTIRTAGYEVNIIYPDDYGIHNYGDTLIATDDLIASQPDLVLRFLRATLQGWTYAVEYPDETGVMVAAYNPIANPALENDKMAASIPLINTGEDHIGWMRPEIWAGMEQTLRAGGVLTGELDLNEAYTMQFLEAIYK